jgi:hypothetical protein
LRPIGDRFSARPCTAIRQIIGKSIENVGRTVKVDEQPSLATVGFVAMKIIDPLLGSRKLRSAIHYNCELRPAGYDTSTPS